MSKAWLFYANLAVAPLLLLATLVKAASYFNVSQLHYNAPLQCASPEPFANHHHPPEQSPCFNFFNVYILHCFYPPRERSTEMYFFIIIIIILIFFTADK